MTTKPGTTIQPLDFDDLDRVVGGRATMGDVLPESHAHEAASAFMASLHSIAAVAASGSALGDDRPQPQAADHRATAAATPERAIQPSPGGEPHAPAADNAGDPLRADVVLRLLGPEAAHELDAARVRVAATAKPIMLFHPAHDAVQEGFGPLLASWEDDFAQHLAGNVDSERSLALTPITDDAIRGETHVLRAEPTAPEILAATAPYFLTECQALFEDRRQKIAALFAAFPKIAAAEPR